MAMENKRIIQLNTERTTPVADDYVMVDSATAGTAKYLLPKITDAIDQEISDRTSADTALQTAITNETTARANADTTLQGNITAEATARAEADTAINGEITQLKEDLTAEETARENAVSAEATAREAADDAIYATLANKANVNGYYQEMTVGDAEQLVSTVFVEDSVPYQFRTSGGSDDIGDREYDEIVGGSIVWNQLAHSFITRTNVLGITISADNTNGSITITGTATATNSLHFENGIPLSKDHVYLIRGAKTHGINISTHPSIDTGNGAIFKATQVLSNTQFVYRFNEGDVINETIYPQRFDLTQMFGSTIADYIYSLEQATAGAGVAFFKKLFPNGYYAYDAGTMMHVSGLSSHDMVGFNALPTTPEYISNAQTLDKSKAVRVIAGQQYQFTFDGIGSATNWRIFAKFWDLSENMQIGGTIPFSVSNGSPAWNASYYGWLDGADSSNHNRTYTFNRDGYLTLQFWGGNTTSSMEMKNPCFHLVWDGERDGEYEPYVKHSYPLDDSLTLRGVPKLDASNNLYYDGDIWHPDGTIDRRYGVVDLGTLSWVYNSSLNLFWVDFALATRPCGLMCTKYAQDHSVQMENIADKSIWNERYGFSPTNLVVKDTAYTDAVTFKTAMSGVYLVFELATPTTEEAEPYNEVQIVDDFGTEEYVTTSLVPVGHYTKYPANLRSAIERVMEQVPEAPSANGTYVLKVTKTSSGVTYAWTAE